MTFFDSISAAALIGFAFSFGQWNIGRSKLRIELSKPRHEAHIRTLRAIERHFSKICSYTSDKDIEDIETLRVFWSAKDEMERVFGKDVSEILKEVQEVFLELLNLKLEILASGEYNSELMKNWCKVSSKLCINLPNKLSIAVKKYVSLEDKFAGLLSS